MKKRLSALFVTLLLLATMAVPAFAAGKYKITVNCKTNVVTVYEKSESGEYTDIVKAFVCSTGKPETPTPLGDFTLTGYKAEWIHMQDDSYGQYCTQIKGNYLFHSVCYEKADRSTLITSEYDDLGKSVSLGCVRLQAADAKWIYDNCGWGMTVSIIESDEDPVKPEKYIDAIPERYPQGWDPTDTDAKNPWRNLEDYSDVRVGSRYYDSIHYCAENKLLNGVGNGRFSPDGIVTGAMAAQALYNAAGRPKVQTEGTKWYSQAVRWLETEYPELRLEPEEPVLKSAVKALAGDKDNSDTLMTRGELAELLMEIHNG